MQKPVYLRNILLNGQGGFSCSGAFLPLAVREKDSKRVVLENGDVLYSGMLARMLSSCGSVVYVAVSLEDAENSGFVLSRLLGHEQKSRAVNDAVKVLMKIAGNQLRQKGLSLLPRRFCPGTGDLPLAVNSLIYQALHLEQMGIKQKEGAMLDPQYTALSVTGAYYG